MPNQTPQANTTSSLDPDVVNLAKAVRDVESGGNPTASGKSGEYGAYQYEPTTWDSQSKAAGVNVPLQQATLQQQNEVWYKWAKSKKDAGYNVGQIASMQNAGEGKPNAYIDGNKGTNSNGVSYDTAEYAKKVATAYQQYKNAGTNNNAIQPPVAAGQQSLQSAGTSIVPPTPPTSSSTPTTSVSGNSDNGVLSDISKGDYAGAAVGAAKGVGNFLFPIVGDVYHDIKGDSQKTALQQAGDTALSALPFVPGLGEAGEAARGAEGVVEGGGLLSKLAGNTALKTAAKGAGIGYGAGIASNLSQGKDIGESVAPNLSNVLGAVTGGVAPSIFKGATGLAKKISGIDPQVETELARMGSQPNVEDSSLYEKYLNATKAHATDLKAKPPLTMAADELDKAAADVTSQRKDAGAAVGAAKKAGANLSLGPLDAIGQEFQKQVSDKYGLTLTSDEAGKVTAAQAEGSMRQVSKADTQRIENIATQLNKLHNEGGNVQNATEVLNNLDDLIDHSKNDVYGHTNDPLAGLIKSTAGNLSDHMKQVSPEIADTYQKFSGLKDLEREIKTMAGGSLNRGELLMRRVFSGDKSGDVQDFFGKLQQATGIDLTKHAVLAKHAIQTVGSKADKTLLEQIIGAAAGGHGGGLMNLVANAGRGAAKKTFANPEKIGRNLVQGKKSGLLPSLLTASAVRGATSISK